MRTLIVEDEFTSRRLLQKILEPYGEVDIASDGQEAVEAFGLALNENRPYDLICLDIMMPKMDGQEALKEFRHIEDGLGIHGLDGVKILMTTVLKDPQNVMAAFRSQCEGYLVKPIRRDRLHEQLLKLGLVESGTSVPGQYASSSE
jgi:two-component system chemotaxis response regulator CheY